MQKNSNMKAVWILTNRCDFMGTEDSEAFKLARPGAIPPAPDGIACFRTEKLLRPSLGCCRRSSLIKEPQLSLCSRCHPSRRTLSSREFFLATAR
jgi:hypothetical protein